MNVEEYLRSLVPGVFLQDSVVARAARSPKDVGLLPLPLDEDVDVTDDGNGQLVQRNDEEYQKRLDYASSTVYYSVLRVIAGGGISEQVGDVRTSVSGISITKSDRAHYKALGDDLRLKWGFAVEPDGSGSEMFDATCLVQ